jgi:hypothetical protein
VETAVRETVTAPGGARTPGVTTTVTVETAVRETVRTTPVRGTVRTTPVRGTVTTTPGRVRSLVLANDAGA